MKINLNGQQYKAKVVAPAKLVNDDWSPRGVVLTFQYKLLLTAKELERILQPKSKAIRKMTMAPTKGRLVNSVIKS